MRQEALHGGCLQRISGKEAKMKRILSAVSVMLWSLAFTGISTATTATGNLQVTATVGSICSVSTTAVDFGIITGIGNGTGDVTVNCPVSTLYSIALDYGLHYDPNTLRRYLANGQDLLRYRLFQPDNQTQWGDSDYANTYPEGSSFADTGSGSDQLHTVYGQTTTPTGIPAGTVLADTVTVTVHY